MNLINAEFYSMVILSIIILDYVLKFKKKFTTASILWLTLTISTMIISISNIIFSMTDVYLIKLISITFYLLATLIASLFIYVYVKYVYINPKINIKKEIYYTFFSVLICIIITIIYVFFSNSGYILHSFNRTFLNKLLMLAIIPNVVICIMYIYDNVKNNKKLSYKLIATLLITVIALILDIMNTSLFFVSGTFTLTSLILYINKHERLLNTDPLTGLSNKRSLEIFIENLKPNLNIAAYNFDVNKFKEINDKYGHLKGDLALKKIAQILRNSSRDRDLVIRNGGDEFLIIAVIRKEEDATKLLERINENLEKYNNDAEIKIGISTGWGVYKSNENPSMDEFTNFLKSIDDKMYIEKEKTHKKGK